MPLMNIEVEMHNKEQLALISTITQMLENPDSTICGAGRSALFKVRQAAIHAVEIKAEHITLEVAAQSGQLQEAVTC